jgi:hypothetical protein
VARTASAKAVAFAARRDVLNADVEFLRDAEPMVPNSAVAADEALAAERQTLGRRPEVLRVKAVPDLGRWARIACRRTLMRSGVTPSDSVRWT